MNILVTGGGGFLGKAIIDQLLDKKYKVTNFSRSLYKELERKGVTCIQGDIKNPQDVLKASEGQDAIIHVASKVGMWGKWSDFYDTNVTGTENVINSCIKNHIKKLVYTSSPSVVFGKDDLQNADESTPYPDKYIGLYAHSKAIAEKKVLESSTSPKLLTTALRPHLIFGEKDPNLIPRLVKAAKEGRLKQVGPGQNLVDVIYVENAAYAHILALEKLYPSSPICGKAYFLGQEAPVNLWEFINRILNIHGLPPVKKTISFKKAYFLGALIEKTLGLLRKYSADPPMTRFIATQLSKSHYFSHKNAFTELGYHPLLTTEKALERLSTAQ
ncbi:MAG: 3-beta hydroxysteroid dehydrogenase [Halobacteriovoraceae bacterium]|nr:3-beta hydroxysteroid dehydrogenase [Halobacteriovoraceae bacterium]